MYLYIPYMDPMGYVSYVPLSWGWIWFHHLRIEGLLRDATELEVLEDPIPVEQEMVPLLI